MRSRPTTTTATSRCRPTAGRAGSRSPRTRPRRRTRTVRTWATGSPVCPADRGAPHRGERRAHPRPRHLRRPPAAARRGHSLRGAHDRPGVLHGRVGSASVTGAQDGLKPVRYGVIPAGGLGTRFLPISRTVPKELLPIIDTPIIEMIVSEMAASGIARVVVVIAPGKEALDAYFR